MFVSDCAKMSYLITTSCSAVFLLLWFKVNSIATETGIYNSGPNHGKIVACYWATWSQYRPDAGVFLFDNINPRLCTHLLLAFVLLEDDDSVKLIGNWDYIQVDENGQSNVTDLKKNYPHLKVMVSIGGWQDGSVRYSKMVGDPIKRSTFVNNTANFLRERNLDGLDIFWQWPTKRGGSIHDKVNYVELIKELRKEYDKYGLLLTAAVGASKNTIDNAYNVKELSYYLDYMLMMTYDYNGWWGRAIGPHAPLVGPDALNVKYTINYILKLGADPEKLVLGLPDYGRTFISLKSINTSQPLRAAGKHKNHTFYGSYSRDKGFMGYNEICLEVFDKKSNWTLYWDAESQTPYALNDDKLITYDNERSITEKIRFALDLDMAGVMIWAMDFDDFRGDCYEVIDGQRDFPFLRIINKKINEFVNEKKYKISSLASHGVSYFKIDYSPLLTLFSLLTYFTF